MISDDKLSCLLNDSEEENSDKEIYTCENDYNENILNNDENVDNYILKFSINKKDNMLNFDEIYNLNVNKNNLNKNKSTHIYKEYNEIQKPINKNYILDNKQECENTEITDNFLQRNFEKCKNVENKYNYLLQNNINEYNKTYNTDDFFELTSPNKVDTNIKDCKLTNKNHDSSNSLERNNLKQVHDDKDEKLIFYFSFIKYKSWIKALNILKFPIDNFHLAINAHKYICTNNKYENMWKENNDFNLYDKSFLYKWNIHNIINNKNISNYKIQRMLVIVRNIINRINGNFLIVMDPTGHLPATLHKEVEKEYKKYINIGSTFLLRNVTVFQTIDNFPYLIITLRSLVRIIKAEQIDAKLKEKIFKQIRF